MTSASDREIQMVFQMWNEDYLLSPEAYDEITTEDDCACRQMKHFKALLIELRKEGK